MAGYQRFVAYVYEYRKGKKDGSSGYVRVEARDRKCRDGGSSALRWTGAWKSVQSVWVCAAGRADGWYFDRKLCYRAGADRVRTGDGHRGYWRHGKKSSGAWRTASDLRCRRILGNGMG